MNYLPYDSLGQPPGAQLTTSSTNGEATAGGFVVLHATVSDDVQVRRVEFFVDGQLLVVDGSFPFETVYCVPKGSEGSTLAFTATATDSGGNITNVPPVQLVAIPDIQAPVIRIDVPAVGV